MRHILQVSFLSLLAASPVLAMNDNADRKAARENFMQADANKDALLSKSEFKNFINANADDDLGRASMVRRFGAYDRAFARVDANKDGFVSGKELAASQQQ